MRCSLLSLTVSIIHVPHSAAESTDTEIFPSLSFSLSLSQMIITITTLVAMIQPLSPSPVTANNSSDLVITRGGIPPRSPALSPLPPPILSLSPRTSDLTYLLFHRYASCRRARRGKIKELAMRERSFGTGKLAYRVKFFCHLRSRLNFSTSRLVIAIVSTNNPET